MHAVRVPLLGMAVAVALLLVENVGAIAYRNHVMASVDAQVAATKADAARSRASESNVRLRKILDEAEATLREVEKLTRETGAYRVHHCNER